MSRLPGTAGSNPALSATLRSLHLDMDYNERKFWVSFNRIPGLGRARFSLMENRFGALSRAWEASSAELSDAGLDRKTVQSILRRRGSIDPDAEVAGLESQGVKAFTWHDDGYPPRLKEIYDLPPLLYVRGELLPGDERSIAIVGTRKPTAYGRQAAYQMTFDLARSGVAIVSGLARGVDGIAHRASIDAEQRTIAILAGGLDWIYPKEHRRLSEAITENGALVSEHPLGTRPAPGNFPRRNRIMAGMTLGTIVVEANRVSGALITARHALEQNREVFAVPGSILSPASEGTNALIRDSAAKLVTDHTDVLEELNLTYVEQQIETKALFPENEDESQVLKHVTYDPVHVDEIVRTAGLPTSTVSSVLAMMELKSMARLVGGMTYVRLKETRSEYDTAEQGNYA